MNETEVALICKAMADPQRLRIVRMLRDADRCATEILEELEISQPTLSHHMKILCDCGLVRSKKEGKKTCYFLCCRKMHSFGGFIISLECPSYGSEICHCVTACCEEA